MMTAPETSAGTPAESHGLHRGPTMAAFVLLVLGLALRVAGCLHHPVRGEEMQCLHVAWSWTQGLVHYRDVTDSQMPLFQMLCAPLLRMMGERADVAVMMRLWMLPLFAVALWAVYRIGRALFSRRVALWAAGITSVCPVFVGAALEFRPETAWLTLWLWTLAVLVEGRLTSGRSLLTGFVLGAALAVSAGTVLLLLSLWLAAVVLAVLLPKAQRGTITARICDRGSVALAGFAVVPAAVAAFFLANDALPALYQCAYGMNAAAGSGAWRGCPVVPLALLPLWSWIGWRVLRRATDASLGVRRAMLLLVCGIQIALSSSPLSVFSASQTSVVILPMSVILMTPVLLAAARWFGHRMVTPLARIAKPSTIANTGQESEMELLRAWMSRRRLAISGFFMPHEPPATRARSAWGIEAALLAAVAAVVAGFSVKLESPWLDRAAEHRGLLVETFRLTKAGERVMDLQGEAVFRRRPAPDLLDATSRRLMARGLAADTIPERLVESRVCVATADNDRWPTRARLFLMKNYLPVGRLRVAGCFLTAPATATDVARVFDVQVPASYVIVGENGPVAGTLDGQPLAGPVFLKAGRHAFRPATPIGRLALFWAPALERGFSPFWE